MHHLLLVPMHQETKVRIMDRICRTSKLDQKSLKEVWHKEEVGILHIPSVVEPTQVSVMMARQVTSSMLKRVTSYESALRTGRVVEIPATQPDLIELLH